jgi:N-formylglutamate amidohydrolase
VSDASLIAPAPLGSRPGCYSLHLPDPFEAPMVFSSPHSGRAYGATFLSVSRLDALTLRRSEDSFVEELFAAVPAQGGAFIAAEFPRAWCDVNRERWELDPEMFEDRLPDWVNITSPRVAAGLGTIARVVSTGAAIYGGRLRFADAEQRVASCWDPYHAALQSLIEDVRTRFGACVLVDCHSMPAHACSDRRPVPDIILGDGYGATCAPSLIAHAEAFLKGCGYVVRRNDPYAGGFVTRHYGKPARGVHALQVEIARRLYMTEATMEKHAGFTRVERDMSQFAASLGQAASRLIG